MGTKQINIGRPVVRAGIPVWGRVVTGIPRLLIAFVAALLLAMGSIPAARSAEGNPGVLPPNAPAFGKSYGAWSAAWWQYVLGQPASANPLTDPTGALCSVGQSGPVFFLVGTFGSGAVSRDECTVPAGKALFFPLVNAFDVHVPGDGLDTPELVWDDLHVNLGFRIFELHASIDGIPVRSLDPVDTPYRACAGPVAGCATSFSLTLPADNFFGVPAGIYAPAVADGVYLLLRPLAPGSHTITFGGRGFLTGEFSQEITYHLTVR
jgi:hypothetical protein